MLALIRLSSRSWRYSLLVYWLPRITMMDQVAVDNMPLSQSHFQGSYRQLAVRLLLH